MVRERSIGKNVRVNRSRKKTDRVLLTRRQIGSIVLFVILFMGCGIGYVWSNFENTQRGYDLSQLRQEERRLREINLNLKVDLAVAKSIAHLESVAERRGMKMPSSEQVVFLR